MRDWGGRAGPGLVDKSEGLGAGLAPTGRLGPPGLSNRPGGAASMGPHIFFDSLSDLTVVVVFDFRGVIISSHESGSSL